MGQINNISISWQISSLNYWVCFLLSLIRPAPSYAYFVSIPDDLPVSVPAPESPVESSSSDFGLFSGQ